MRVLAAAYFLIQGVAGLVWWTMLLLHQGFYDAFEALEVEQPILRSFLLPDLLLFSFGSLLTAVFGLSQKPQAKFASALTLGATAYAALFTLGLLGSFTFPLLSVVSMGFALLGTATATAILWKVPESRASDPVPGFRVAKQAGHGWNLAKTLLHTAFFWSIFLGLIPLVIQAFEQQAGIDAFQLREQGAVSLILFLLASFLGLWSGVTMAVVGRGTPLPLDTARALVIAGPYAFLRNPMALAGLAQGAAVGLFLGSPLTLAYVLFGGLLWHVGVRPMEERDLQQRFGQPYDDYRKVVRCWIPRRSGYRMPATKAAGG